MGKIKGVHHISLKPNSELYQKTVDFYTKVLGCTTLRIWGEGETEGCMLSCADGTSMEITHGKYDGTVNTGSLNHIAFAVDAVDKFIEDIRSAGYKITIEPRKINIGGNFPAQIAFFEGPVGETVELFEEL